MNTIPEWAAGSVEYRAYLNAAARCRVAFNPIRPDFSTWIHPSTGERRRYITNVAEILHFTYDGQGVKVHSGVLDGEALSNNQTYKLVQLIHDCGFWVDAERGLHYHNAPSSSRHHTPETIADAINATRTR